MGELYINHISIKLLTVKDRQKKKKKIPHAPWCAQNKKKERTDSGLYKPSPSPLHLTP